MCVEEGRYEEALQISTQWKIADVNRAHIKLLAKYRSCSHTRELINQAKGRIVCETTLEKGRRFSRIGQKEQAVSLLIDALRDGGEADDFLLVGQLLEQLWRIDSALEFFEAAVRVRGDAGDHLWLGTALERLSRYEEALVQYKEAALLRGAPEDFLARGSLLYRLKRLDEAEKYLLKSHALGERSTSIQLLQAIKADRGRARIRKLLSSVASIFNGKNGKDTTVGKG